MKSQFIFIALIRILTICASFLNFSSFLSFLPENCAIVLLNISWSLNSFLLLALCALLCFQLQKNTIFNPKSEGH